MASLALSSLCGYEPFFADNEATMFQNILKGDYGFDTVYWDDVSLNAKVIYIYIYPFPYLL